MPTSRLQLHFERFYVAANNFLLGSCTPAVSVTATQNGGFYVHPQRTPVDLDLSRPARLYVALFAGVNSTPTPGDVEIRAGCNITDPTNDVLDESFSNYLPIPANFPFKRPTYFELTADGDPMFPAHSLTPHSIFGLRISRNGGSIEDNWPYTLGIVTTAWLEYSQNCRYGCL